MIKTAAILAFGAVSSAYLFFTAPPPLPDGSGYAETADVTAAQMFHAVNLINATARQIYTRDIVTAGKEVGLKFDEHWMDDGVQAGPLPALFLRQVATNLDGFDSPLGLFLGSDQPIAASNQFKGDMLDRIGVMRTDSQPQFFRMEEMALDVGMFPDIASAEGCVKCHNEHPSSPKTDWQLNDIMGATTWTYPRGAVSRSEFRARLAEVYLAIETSYGQYLNRTQGFDDAPVIGTDWPASGQRVLPDAATFMETLYAATAPQIVRIGLTEPEAASLKVTE